MGGRQTRKLRPFLDGGQGLRFRRTAVIGSVAKESHGPGEREE